MIKARQLSKIYGSSAALSDIDLTLERRRILGIVGTNGSGRTTLLRILATQLKPTNGSLEIDGTDALKHPFRVRPKIGYVAQTQSFYDSMTVGECLRFVAACQNEKLGRSSVLAEPPFDGLAQEMPLRSLSHGTRQKLALTAMLIHNPSLLILDEPLTHLDPIAVGRFKKLIEDFRLQGGTVVMACNQISEIRSLCDEVAFMHQGRILQIVKLGEFDTDLREALVELVARQSAEQNSPSDGARKI
jgi:ABC-2 type transport system ATP-binding protein